MQQEAISLGCYPWCRLRTNTGNTQCYPLPSGSHRALAMFFFAVESAARSKAAHPVGSAILGFLPAHVHLRQSQVPDIFSPRNRFLRLPLWLRGLSREPWVSDSPFRPPSHPRFHSPDCPSLLWAAARHQLLGVWAPPLWKVSQQHLSAVVPPFSSSAQSPTTAARRL